MKKLFFSVNPKTLKHCLSLLLFIDLLAVPWSAKGQCNGLIFQNLVAYSGGVKFDVVWNIVPSSLSGVNISVDINTSNVSIDVAQTIASTNPQFTSFCSTTVNGNSITLNGLANAPQNIPLVLNQRLFTVFVIANAGQCFTASSVNARALYGAVPQFCEITLPTPVSYCFPALTISGNLEASFIASQCNEIPPPPSTNHVMRNVNVEIRNENNLSQLFCTPTTNLQGNYTSCGLNVGRNYRVIPVRQDNPACGISTQDLLLVSQHILGKVLLTEPWKLIAVDATGSGTITTHDMVLMSNLINGTPINPLMFPDFRSWKFIPRKSYFLLPNPSDVYPIYDAYTTINDLQTNSIGNRFLGIKAGDVNGSCTDCDGANFTANEERSLGSREIHELHIPDIQGKEGDILDVPIENINSLTTDIFSLCVNFSVEFFDVLTVKNGDFNNADDAKYSIDKNGNLKFIWFSQFLERISLSNEEKLFTVRLKLKKDVENVANWIRLKKDVLENAYSNVVTNQLHPFELNTSRTKLNAATAFPNPTTGTTTIQFENRTEGDMYFSTMNYKGEIVKEFQQWGMKGSNSVALDMSNLPSGIYFTNIRTAADTYRLKVVKTN